MEPSPHQTAQRDFLRESQSKSMVTQQVELLGLARKQEAARASLVEDSHNEFVSSLQNKHEQEMELLKRQVDEREKKVDKRAEQVEVHLKDLRIALESAKWFNEKAKKNGSESPNEGRKDILRQKEEQIRRLEAQLAESFGVIEAKEQYASELEAKKVEAELSYQTVQRDLTRESQNKELLMQELEVRDETQKQEATRTSLLLDNHTDVVASLKQKHEQEIELVKREVDEREHRVDKRGEQVETHLKDLRVALESAKRYNKIAKKEDNESSNGGWKDVVRQKEDQIHRLEVEVVELTSVMDTKEQYVSELESWCTEQQKAVKNHHSVEKLCKQIDVKELKSAKLQQLLSAKNIKLNNMMRKMQELAKKCAVLEHHVVEKTEANVHLIKENAELHQRQMESHKLFENTSRRAKELHKMVTSDGAADRSEVLVEEIRQLRGKNTLLLSMAQETEIALEMKTKEPCTVCEETRATREEEIIKTDILIDEARAAARAEVASAELCAHELRAECTEISEQIASTRKNNNELEEALRDQLWHSEVEFERATFEGMEFRTEHDLAVRQLNEANEEITSLVEKHERQEGGSLLLREKEMARESEKLIYREEAFEALEELGYWQRKSMLHGSELFSVKEEMQLMAEENVASRTDKQQASSDNTGETKLSPIEATLRHENRQLRTQLHDIQNSMEYFRKQEVALRTEIIKLKSVATDNTLRDEMKVRLAENQEAWEGKYAERGQELVNANENVRSYKLQAAAAEKRIILLMQWIRSIKTASESSWDASASGGLREIINDAYVSLDNDSTSPKWSPPHKFDARQASVFSADSGFSRPPRSNKGFFRSGTVDSRASVLKSPDHASKQNVELRETLTTAFGSTKFVEKLNAGGLPGKITPDERRDSKAPRRQTMTSVRKMKLAEKPLRSNLRKASPQQRKTMASGEMSIPKQFSAVRRTHHSAMVGSADRSSWD
eukprot:GEMP01004628.1.p1 GENE.GEMP01004628.1~~GEMP01004628.1.p1  ORF type:complete len:961 (+),score=247.36 GEMP01004628.1:247-3129(+)